MQLESMPDEIHYSEDDAAAIFQSAIKAQEEARSKIRGREGLTLRELQEIGAELGITPEFIQRAAVSQRAQVTARPDQKILGIPVSVERILELPRQLTEDEWGLLVADLRDTFDARGTLKQDGTLRQWTNGNLSAMTEPATGGGYRLRLRTRKGNASSGLAVAGMMSAFGLMLFVLLLFKDLPQDPSKFAFAASFLVAALVAAGFTVSTVPRWHKERSAQMDAIAGRVAAMVGQDERAPDTAAAESVESSTPVSDAPELLELESFDHDEDVLQRRARRSDRREKN